MRALVLVCGVGATSSLGAACDHGGADPSSPDAALPAAVTDAGALSATLIDHSQWQRYAPELDPLPSHQPVALACAESAARVELDSYEVDTTRCNYLLSAHPAQRALAPASKVQLTLLHYDLAAPEPAEAHVALFFDQDLQWETHIPIPSPGAALEASFLTTRALAAGEPIRLHLHNHGGNTWLLVSLDAVVAP